MNGRLNCCRINHKGDYTFMLLLSFSRSHSRAHRSNSHWLIDVCLGSPIIPSVDYFHTSKRDHLLRHVPKLIIIQIELRFVVRMVTISLDVFRSLRAVVGRWHQHWTILLFITSQCQREYSKQRIKDFLETDCDPQRNYARRSDLIKEAFYWRGLQYNQFL